MFQCFICLRPWKHWIYGTETEVGWLTALLGPSMWNISQYLGLDELGLDELGLDKLGLDELGFK